MVDELAALLYFKVDRATQTVSSSQVRKSERHSIKLSKRICSWAMLRCFLEAVARALQDERKSSVDDSSEEGKHGPGGSKSLCDTPAVKTYRQESLSRLPVHWPRQPDTDMNDTLPIETFTSAHLP